MLEDKVIFVVDDWEVDRIRVVERLRSGVDARYVVAPDGLAALELMDREKPDLVVTDLVMPRMDGLRLVEHIRRRYPFVPSVLITSRGSEEIAWQALERGAVSFVPKQELGRLADTVMSVLQLSIGYRQQEKLRSYWHRTESQFCLDNEVPAIAVLVSHLQQQASSLRSLDDTECFRLGMALQEALRNAVEHGNLELCSSLRYADGARDQRPNFYELAEVRRQQAPFCQRRVRVTVHESPEAGRYTIRDEGPGFDKRVLGFDPTDAANVDRPSGRGLFLIHTFMDEVDFNERGNEITMTHRYRPPNGTRCDDAPESPMAAAARAPLTAAAAPDQQRE